MNPFNFDPIILSIVTTLGVCVLAVYLAYNTGMVRKKYGLQPYLPSDHPELHKATRAHMNILESIVAFIPVLWIAAIFGSTFYAWVAWIVWLISRIVYAFVYLSHPEKRMIPFLISLICFVIVLVIAIMGGMRIV